MATLRDNYWGIPRIVRGPHVLYLRRSNRPYTRLDAKAQRQAAQAVLEGHPAKIVATFTETEPLVSGQRPELERAIAVCRAKNARLLFGKLDRMRGMLKWLRRLNDERVKVIAADGPAYCWVDYWFISAGERDWRRSMSKSVSEALAKAKSNGTLLGGRHGNPTNLKLGPPSSAKARKRRARNRDQNTISKINYLQERGITTLTLISKRLNQMKHPAPRGGEWSPTQVSRVIEKFKF